VKHVAVLWLWGTIGLLLASGGCNRTPRGAPVPLRLLPADAHVAVTYVALGDSTVAGVGATRPERTYVHRLAARLRTVYPRVRLVNLGVSGTTAADVVASQLPAALQQAPTLVTLSIGPNDLLASHP
jgi:lysophospholipase L1-like esterase